MPTPTKTRKPKVSRSRAATKKPIASKVAAHRPSRVAKTASAAKATAAAANPKEGSKQARMITMLRTEAGASIDQLIRLLDGRPTPCAELSASPCAAASA